MINESKTLEIENVNEMVELGRNTSSEAMNKLKQKNLETYKNLPLPKEKEEDWRYTNVENLDIPKNFTQGEIFCTKIPRNLAEKGVIFCDINTAFEKHYDTVQKYYFKNIKEDKDKFIAMNSALFTDGIFLFVPKNVEVDLPINVNLFVSNSIVHNIIAVEENSSIIFVEEIGNKKNFAEQIFFLNNEITEIFVGENSKVNYYNLRNLDKNSYSFSHKIAKLEKNSSINWHSACFGGKINRLRIDTNLEGDGSESKNIGLFFGREREHIDVTTNVLHNALNTTNNIKFDGILKEFSTSVYRGLITITKKGQQTNSYLSDNIIKIGEGTLANSIPSLKIDANDVKASHGVTIGQVSEEHLFYLMSRGLTRENAEKLIVQGFLEPIIDKIKLEDFKEKIRNLIC